MMPALRTLRGSYDTALKGYLDEAAKRNDALLQKYAIDGLLLDAKGQKGLIEAVRSAGGWVERYKDKHTVYFTHAAQ